MRVFISSPYSNGDTITDADVLTANVNRSIDAAEQLAQHGHVPFVPLLSHYWQQQFAHDHAFWMRWCIEWLAQCDAMLVLDGDSVGVTEEIRSATKLGIPIYHTAADIPANGKE